MKSKFIIPAFFAFITILVISGTCNRAYAQSNDANQPTLEIKSAFFGNWKETQDPAHLLEIYKEGSFIIVNKRSEKNDGSGSKKYTVVSEKGNRIMVDWGTGLTPLTITDDGNKIYFQGIEYLKK